MLPPGISLADPKLYFFPDNSNFRFILYDFPLIYADKAPGTITIPGGSSQVRSASYSIDGQNYISTTLPSTSLSISVQFERTCVIPILVASRGSTPSVTFVTQTPQEFYFSADECGAPNIDTYSRTTMGKITPFGYNTFNAGQTDFFAQSLSLTPSANGYNFNVVMYCPYFQTGSKTFGFKMTVDVGQSSTGSVSLYTSSGSLVNQTQTVTVGAGQTVTLAIRSSETGVSFPVQTGLSTTADYTTTSGSALTGQASPDQPVSGTGRRLGSTTSTLSPTVANNRYTYAFPSGYSSAQVYLVNSGTASISVAVQLTTGGSTLLIPLNYILIIVGAGVGVILLAILIPLLVIKLSKKEEPRIVYEQRTFIINNQIVQQDVHLLDGRHMNTSGFHVNEMREGEWVELAREEQMRRPAASQGKGETAKGKEAAKKPAMTVYSVELKARPRAVNEKNILANYLERTI